MAELETIPINEEESEEERRRRELEELNAQPAASGVQPAVAPNLGKNLASHAPGTDLKLEDAIERTHPRGASIKEGSLEPINAPDVSASPEPVNGGLQSLAAPSPVKALSFAERQALPVISPGAPAGSAASYEAQLTKLQDKKDNPWGTAENHPGVLGKIGHVLGRIGNVAGDIVAPGTMELIPGTDLNRNVQKAELERNLSGAQEREGRQAREKTEAEQSEERIGLERRRIEDEENKEPKAGTIDQQAVDAKMKETNPETGKPYTAYEARIELNNDIQAGKAKPAGAPKTIVMQDPNGKPFEYEYDGKGNYSGDAGYGQWKKVGPAKPDALSLGLVGSIQPLLGQNGQIVGTLNSKTGKMAGLTPEQQEAVGGTGGGTTSSGARLANTERNQFNTQYVKPSTDIEQNFRKFQGAYNDYLANPQTGAASMVALAQHLGSTFGSIKGTSQGENMIREHKDAIGLLDRIGRYVDNVVSGQQLSASQWKEFHDLIANTRQIQWETTAREAARRKQPVDFLPADVQINLADSSGKVRHVPGNRVQEYLDKGAKIAE